MILRRTLTSGLRVVVEQVPDVRSVAVGVWVGVGSRHEHEGVFGGTHFLEHLLFKGTDRWGAAEIARAIDSVGGEFNAYTTKEHTAYYVRTLDDDLPLGLDVLADITQRPAFRADELESERSVVLEEINVYEDTPDDLVHDLFMETIYEGHRLGRPILGTRDSIAAMSRDSVADWFDGAYTPDRMVVAAAGNVDPEAFAEDVAGRWDRSTAPSSSASDGPPPLPVTRARVEEKPIEQAHVVVGMPTMPLPDDRRHALAILNHVIGGGMSSRLFQEIREKRGLVYTVYSYRNLFSDCGLWAAYAGSSPARLEETLSVLDRELDTLDRGVTPEEFEGAKTHMRGALALSSEDTGSRMARLGRGEITLGEAPSLDETVARIDAVTLDEVNDVAAELASTPRTVTLLGPEGEVDDGLAEIVAR